MKYCKKCVMPDTRPGIKFNEEGICYPCLNYEKRKNIDWEDRYRQLEELCNKYRGSNGKGYDCIIAVSGGKDSHFQVYVMKELMGMNPLLVSVEDNKINGVLKRDVSYMARAPQTFDVSLLKLAHKKAIADNNFSFVDSCAIVKHYFPESDFNVVECGSENIKITTQEDFYLAKAMFSLEEDEQLYGFRRGDEKR